MGKKNRGGNGGATAPAGNASKKAVPPSPKQSQPAPTALLESEDAVAPLPVPHEASMERDDAALHAPNESDPTTLNSSQAADELLGERRSPTPDPQRDTVPTPNDHLGVTLRDVGPAAPEIQGADEDHSRDILEIVRTEAPVVADTARRSPTPAEVAAITEVPPELPAGPSLQPASTSVVARGRTDVASSTRRRSHSVPLFGNSNAERKTVGPAIVGETTVLPMRPLQTQEQLLPGMAVLTAVVQPQEKSAPMPERSESPVAPNNTVRLFTKRRTFHVAGGDDDDYDLVGSDEGIEGFRHDPIQNLSQLLYAWIIEEKNHPRLVAIMNDTMATYREKNRSLLADLLQHDEVAIQLVTLDNIVVKFINKLSNADSWQTSLTGFLSLNRMIIEALVIAFCRDMDSIITSNTANTSKFTREELLKTHDDLTRKAINVGDSAEAIFNNIKTIILYVERERVAAGLDKKTTPKQAEVTAKLRR